MLGYVLVDVNITDMDGFKEYASRISELMENYGGRYIVKGAEPHVIRSGEDVPQYIVIIEFPSVDNADSFIKERAETNLADLFNRSTVGRILKVEGCV